MLCASATAQEIPLGTWRTHFSYDRVLLLEETPGYIFSSSDVGLFSVHKQSGEVRKYSTLDGLQGVDISALAYDDAGASLYIGYRSGNLDIISGEGITSLDLVSNSQIIGSKAINSIQFSGNRAFIATDYGILDFDTDNYEVRNTYRELGENAAQLGVVDIAVAGDSLIAVSQNGWQSIAIDGVSMADYRNWRRVNVTGGLSQVESTGEEVFFQSADTIYNYSENDFSVLAADGSYRGIGLTNNQLIIYTAEEIQFTDFEGQVEDMLTDDLFTSINTVLADDDNVIWVADGNSGLLRETGSNWEPYSPTGPVRSDMFALNHTGGTLLALTGGFDNSIDPLGRQGSYSWFENGRWENQHLSDDFPDVSDGTFLDDRLFLASADSGILMIDDDGSFRFNDENSALQADASGRTRVTDLKVHESRMYAVNHESSMPLLRFDGQQWEPFSGVPAIGRYAVDAAFEGPVAWLRILRSRGGGVVGFNMETGESRYLGEQPDQGSLASRTVFDLETDRDGFLWIGTDRGVSILFASTRLDGAINAVEPVFDGRPLLVDREVYAIATDGGNRKWMGTDQGVWLFDALADELVVHFTTANSPLPSDVVRDVAIDPETGEVFFLTDAGIASYRSNATVGERAHSEVKIFPNPVRNTFQGSVGISGLTRDAIVKITDVTGRLVYQTRANGGTASWPVRATGGLHTGVYLVFSTSDDGEENYVGKIAIIN